MQTWLPQAFAEKELTTEYGWEVVWGPTVWKNDNQDTIYGPDNVWYVVHNPSVQFTDGSPQEMYVVATAGTANHTSYALKIEDLRIDAWVNFDDWNDVTQQPTQGTPIPAPNPNTSNIAMGTALGVWHVVTYPSPGGSQGANTSLIDFLKTVSSTAKVVYTGHSLGSAISTTLGLAVLKAVPNIPASNVLTFATGGPSPDQGGQEDYQIRNAPIWNTLDIVPMAWSINATTYPNQNLNKLYIIYGTNLANDTLRRINGALKLAKTSPVPYCPIPGVSFDGEFLPIPALPITIDEYFHEAMYQHVVQYNQYIGVTSPKPPPPSPRGTLGAMVFLGDDMPQPNEDCTSKM